MTAPTTYAERVDAQIQALLTQGVTVAMIQKQARLTPERYAALIQDHHGARLIELVYLAQALLSEIPWLVAGDSRQRIKYSPCSLRHLIKSVYPQALMGEKSTVENSSDPYASLNHH